MSLLVDVVGQLEKTGIRCALIGAEALSLRGASRSTLDRDLLTTDPRSLAEALWAPVRLSGSRCEIRRGDARIRSLALCVSPQRASGRST
jgi:hypothetical protein